VVACGAHPGGLVRWDSVAPAGSYRDRFGAYAGEVLRGSDQALAVRLDDDAWVDVRLRPRVTWPRGAFGALGPAHSVPGLPQYWHPVVLAAEVEGEACVGGERVRLDGASAYLEKNWGPGFAGRWWWGHAGAFPDGDVAVAFAGGPLLGRTAPATAIVARFGGRLLRFAPPLALVTGEDWRVRARSVRFSVELEGGAGGSEPHVLPVPDVASGRVEMRSRQHLAGRLHVHLRRGRRTLLDETSPLAGLELGLPPGELSAPRRDESPR
jgi:tocopherol cyclase